MKRDLAIWTLKMAIARWSPPQGCIFQSDRGGQYCPHDYQKTLRNNAAVETFFKIFKVKLIWRRLWETRR